MSDKLTRKEQLFIDEVLTDFNAGRAVRAVGYKAKDPYHFGAELLRKPHILEKIDEAFDERRKKINYQAMEYLEEVRLIAFARMKTYVTVTGNGVALIPTEDLEDGEDAAIQSYSETITQNGGSTSIKLHDKIGALKLYGELLGIFKKASMTAETKLEEAKTIDVKMTPADYIRFLTEHQVKQIPES